MKTRIIQLVVLVALCGMAMSQECTDVNRPATGFFFNRGRSCESRKQNGECEQLVKEGYCLKTCDGCKAPEPIVQAEEPKPAAVEEEETTTEPATTKEEQEEKKAEEYQEKLLEEVALMGDENATAVEVLPTLTMAVAAPAAEASPAAEFKPSSDIQCEASAVANLKNDVNLTTTYEVAQALNLTKVLDMNTIQYTLLAPTNEAWESAAESYGMTLENLLKNRDLTQEIFLSGIIPDLIADNEGMLASRTLDAQSGAVLFFKYGEDDVDTIYAISRYGTGKIVEDSAYIGCNYLIHKIDGVLAETTGKNGPNPDFKSALAGR
jgi:uncharacterized surface protein with fasciclin (FAS1) repeats